MTLPEAITELKSIVSKFSSEKKGPETTDGFEFKAGKFSLSEDLEIDSVKLAKDSKVDVEVKDGKAFLKIEDDGYSKEIELKKEHFEGEEPILTEVKLEEAQLKDGSVIMWDGDLAVGTEVMVVIEGSEPAPAPDGTHELADGTVITTEASIVTEVVPVGEELETPEEELETDNPSNVKSLLKGLEEKIKQLNIKFDAQKKEYEDKLSVTEKELEETKEAVKVTEEFAKQAFEVIEKIAEEPSEKTSKESFARIRKKETISKREAFAESLRALKKQRENLN